MFNLNGWCFASILPPNTEKMRFLQKKIRFSQKKYDFHRKKYDFHRKKSNSFLKMLSLFFLFKKWKDQVTEQVLRFYPESKKDSKDISFEKGFDKYWNEKKNSDWLPTLWTIGEDFDGSGADCGNGEMDENGENGVNVGLA